MFSQAIDGNILTANPGDRINKESQTIEEKAKQVAVDRYDITGDHIKIPTYFIVEHPNGDTEALHHVKDAQRISDIVRQMYLVQEDTPQQQEKDKLTTNISHSFGLVGLLLVSLFVLTTMVVIGIF